MLLSGCSQTGWTRWDLRYAQTSGKERVHPAAPGRPRGDLPACLTTTHTSTKEAQLAGEGTGCATGRVEGYLHPHECSSSGRVRRDRLMLQFL